MHPRESWPLHVVDSGFYAVDPGWQALDPYSLSVKRGFRFQSLARFRASYIEQAPAVQKLDEFIHRINPYPVDSAIGFAHTYPLDSEFIRWIALPIF